VREAEQPADCFNELGDYVRPPTKTKLPDVKFEQAKITVATIAARKRSNEART